jgi:hypothetical protein
MMTRKRRRKMRRRKQKRRMRQRLQKKRKKRKKKKKKKKMMMMTRKPYLTLGQKIEAMTAYLLNLLLELGAPELYSNECVSQTQRKTRNQQVHHLQCM